MAEDLGVELRFADGAFVVDRVYVAPLREVTDQHTERFAFKDAMKMVGPLLGRQYVRSAFDNMLRDHLSRYG